MILHKNEQAIQKSDAGVRISSKPISVGPNRPISHNYRVFAGPKTVEILADYRAEGLASYHKNQWFGIPFAADIARVVITPTLGFTYQVTAGVARLFGRKRELWGRDHPLDRARSWAHVPDRAQTGARRSEDATAPTSPQGAAGKIQGRQGTSDERAVRAYKKHGVNPVAGCLPALIQLPIFVGLWQALTPAFRCGMRLSSGYATCLLPTCSFDFHSRFHFWEAGSMCCRL